MEIDIPCKWKQKETWIPTLLSGKTDFKAKTLIRYKEGHYMIKESFQQEDITFVNIYVLNIDSPKYIKQILMDLKEEMDSNPKIVGDFNTPLSSMDRSVRQKISTETLT